jgi:two-component system, NtrC family, sensor kinase
MKILLIFLILIISCGSAFSQEETFKDAERLLQELSQARTDTGRVVLKSRLSEASRSNNPDTSLILANQALYKAREIGFKKGEIMALNVLCVLHREKGDLPLALQLGLQGLKIAEKEQLSYVWIYSLIRVGNVYLSVGDVSKALPYFQKADKLLERNYDEFQWGVTQYFIAVINLQLNQLDSVENRLVLMENKYSSINNGLRGELAKKRGESRQALMYLKKGLTAAVAENAIREASTASNAIALIFKELNQPDSAIYYAKMGLEFGKELSYTNRILTASSLLAELYAEENPEEAVRFYQMASAAKDSLYGTQKFQQLQSATMEEKERQTEIEAAAIAYRNNIRQWGLIGGVALFLVVAIVLFRNNRQKQKTNKVLETTLSNLKSTQAQLVQQEKLASLGQLTAGIAHEIKNPLNFVNNFSEVSMELIEEIKEERAKKQETRDETLVDEILGDIQSNLGKIHEHGSRADSIVTSMLQHSRGGSGKKEPTDLNALIKEYVNLSFHGMRAGKNPINVDIVLDLDPELREVSLMKEDFTRVVINLCNNAFDAMREKVKMYHVPSMPAGKAGTKYQEGVQSEVNYIPKLRVSTILEKGRVRISFEDNGPGIPDEIRDKILQPFFNTKKGTEGTGLGLSITNDIVKAHGDTIIINSEPGLGVVIKINLIEMIS